MITNNPILILFWDKHIEIPPGNTTPYNFNSPRDTTETELCPIYAKLYTDTDMLLCDRCLKWIH